MFARSLALVVPLLFALPPNDEPTLRAMQSELQRSTDKLRLPNRPPPYFISYWAVDMDQHDVEAVLGTVVFSNHERGRRVHVELRVGSPMLDNSNFVARPSFFSFEFGAPEGGPRPAPQRDRFGLRHTLWLATDSAYKRAVETLEHKHAARQAEVEEKESAPNFSREKPTKLLVDTDYAVENDHDHEALAKRVSAIFREYPAIHAGSVRLTVSTERRYFVSSEGSRVVMPTPYTELSISCATQADDGMALSRSTSIASLSVTPPDEAKTIAEARRIAGELDALRAAPVIEDYSGPVLFEGKAAAQIMYDLLGEAVSGTPAAKGIEYSEGPLARKLGKRVLPKSFSVFDDPTLTEYEAHPLLGHYLVDDEGIPPQRVSLVEEGRLKGFVMSRTPRKEIPQSNGHGRSGLDGWARGKIGNLIVKSSGGLSQQALRARLLRTVREEGGSYGLVIRELEPRQSASNGQAVPDPELLYKLTLDGKEQLVRGATIAQLSVRALREILATGNRSWVYGFAAPSNGFAIPTSVVAPSLLFEDIEVKKRSEPNKRPPLIPRPPLAATESR